MGHLLANNPGQQDAGEILLSGFTHMALQMEAQRRLVMKPGSKPRRAKKGPKKQPQRGLGVAQLEKIRLEDQRRASQHAQQLVALRQLHTGPPLFSSSNAGMQAPASIIPQLERESCNHASSLMHTNPAMISSSLAHFPCIDNIASSFLLNSISAPLTSTVRPSAPAAPLDLFPVVKRAATSSIKVSDDNFAEKNWSLPRVQHGNKYFLENPQSSLNLASDQNNVAHDHRNISYSLLHMRQNCAPPISELRNSGQTNQVPGLDRMVELSFFQSASASSSRSNQLIIPKSLREWGAAQQPGSLLSDLPSLAKSKASHKNEVHCRRSEEEYCELTLRPPAGPGSLMMQEDQQFKRKNLTNNDNNNNNNNARQWGPHNFLSLSVGTSTWHDSVADAGSSTPSPASTPPKTATIPTKTKTTTSTTTTTTTSTTDEYTSSLATSMSHPANFYSTKGFLFNDSHNGPSSSYDLNLDLTLKL